MLQGPAYTDPAPRSEQYSTGSLSLAPLQNRPEPRGAGPRARERLLRLQQTLEADQREADRTGKPKPVRMVTIRESGAPLEAELFLNILNPEWSFEVGVRSSFITILSLMSYIIPFIKCF